jgi:hypothetical protein
MSKKKKKYELKNPNLNPNGTFIEEHGDPNKMSRRQLIAQGFLNGAGVVAAPSVISTLVSQRAFACGDQQEALPSNVPVMVLDLAGGGNLVGPNIVPGKEGGQDDVIGGLGTLGISGSIQAVKKFGLSWHNESMILRGMEGIIPAEAMEKVKGIVFANKSLDDNDTNPVNPSHALIKAGLNGRLVPFAAGNGRVEGTAKSKLPQSSVVSGLTPVQISSSSDANALVKKHQLANDLSPEALDKILKTAANMSESALCEFNKKSLSEQLQAVCGCKHDKSLKIMTEFSEENVSPARDTEIQALYTNTFGIDSQEAAYAKLLVNNFAGVGVLQKGGFDYHNGSRSRGDSKDLMLGDEIGRIIAYAHAINKPIAIVVLTDGAVVSNGATEGGYNGALQGDLNSAGRGDLNPLIQDEQLGQKLAWRSDGSGVRGAAVMFVYHPSGVKLRRSAQIGAFEDGGIVKEVNAISGSGKNLVAAITANWLALQGKQGDISKIMDEDISSSLDEYIGFDKIG